MGKRGPAPKPTVLRVLHGERPYRIPKDEPIPDEGEVAPPEALDAQALEVWQRLAPELIRKGVLTPWDVPLFGAYCQTVAYMRRAEVMVNSSDLLLRSGRDKRDRVVRNPALVSFRDMAELAMRLGGRFGFTPADRAGLASPGGGGDPLPGEHLLSGNWTP